MKTRSVISLFFVIAFNGLAATYEIPYSQNEPELDGVVEGDPFWMNIPAATDFKVFKTLEKAGKKTFFKAVITPKGLWIGIFCEEPGSLQVTAPDNGAIWNDDCVEVFISHQKNKYRHFMVNAGGQRTNHGSVDDSERELDVLWDWKARTFRSIQDWSAEIFIPSHLLGDFEYRPCEIGFNVGRTSTSSNEISSWAGQARTFHDLSGFGKLKFTHLLSPRELAALHEQKQIDTEKQEVLQYTGEISRFYDERRNSTDEFLKKCAGQLISEKNDFETYAEHCLNNYSTKTLNTLKNKGENLKEKFRLFEADYQKQLIHSMENNQMIQTI